MGIEMEWSGIGVRMEWEWDWSENGVECDWSGIGVGIEWEWSGVVRVGKLRSQDTVLSDLFPFVAPSTSGLDQAWQMRCPLVGGLVTHTLAPCSTSLGLSFITKLN